MPPRTVDPTAHINQSLDRGHPADFPVSLKPALVRTNGCHTELPHRRVVVRADTGQPLAVVSDRYTLVPHQQILGVVTQATAGLDVGPVPRGLYVDRQGARMRALFKFPALAQPLTTSDEICPCLKVVNTYDGTSRIGVHIGAFRFVCTNLAVGGGGAFAGGFMAVHAGEIPLDEVTQQLTSYLAGFDRIANLYRAWVALPVPTGALEGLQDSLPKRITKAVARYTEQGPSATVLGGGRSRVAAQNAT